MTTAMAEATTQSPCPADFRSAGNDRPFPSELRGVCVSLRCVGLPGDSTL